MKMTFEVLNSDIGFLNEELFASHQACVGIIEPLAESVDLFIMARCGTAWIEVPLKPSGTKKWAKDLHDAIENHHRLMEWIGDVSFGVFLKSDLYLSICSRIVMPTQAAAAIPYCGRPRIGTDALAGLESNDPAFIITGIQHRTEAGMPHIEAIHGEIPASDEFSLWRDEIPAFARAATCSLDEVIEAIMPRLIEVGNNDPQVILGDNVWGKLFDPQTPTGLWIMHRAIGNFGRGVRIECDECCVE